jgi:folate-binding protein YgfZ
VRSVYGLWLSVKGKVLADSMVLSDAARSEFWIGSYFSPANVIREQLESHVIADDVAIEDLTDAVTGVSIFVDPRVSLPEQTSDPSSFVFSGRRERKPNFEVVYDTSRGEPEWLSAMITSAQCIDPDEITRRRIAAGMPAIPQDVGPGDLPNEAGLEVDAISYTKGCYLGQEVMARLKSMGRLRRRLMRVSGAGNSYPKLPAPLFHDARQVGELRSAVSDGAGGWIGLAMISLLHVAAGAQLSFKAGAPPEVRLVDSP